MKLINEAGKLSEIIKALRPPNVGLIVTPTEYLGFHNEGVHVEMDGERWMCIITDHYWKVFHPLGQLETMYGSSKVAFIPDSWMRPVPPVGKTVVRERGVETT